jgi:hypothetical protein
MVGELLEFAKADGGYRAVYLHTYPDSPGATGAVAVAGQGGV